MNNKILILFFILLTSLFSSISAQKKLDKKAISKAKTVKINEPNEQEKAVAAVKVDTFKFKTILGIDSLNLYNANAKLRLLKKNAHASYYHKKFNGRRTASGKKFDNNGYTAAHKKLPFGTKLKVTNEANGKSVIVEVTDRGPFSKAREIDLSRRAFMDIASNQNSGVTIVTIEEVIEPK
ncbi:MAG: septal ring lytic transglycosylase RlpA family protein [Flavobacterium sp.]|uniref:septal ring lytic transglycosylase RlpA family protein n=1 Tax=Flavobacterium sp. TaxID=239 RepID=UPI003BC90C3E